jgi:hypothetical protein
MWNRYLRVSIENLTTLSFETTSILEDSKIWFSGGQINIGGIRKFYQFESRLMQNGFSTLFGARFQEIYLKMSACLMLLAPSLAHRQDPMEPKGCARYQQSGSS